jgi:hypothetical protein
MHGATAVTLTVVAALGVLASGTAFRPQPAGATTSPGIITTIAGSGSGNAAFGFSGDGGGATSAKLNAPIDVITDAHGDVIIDDYDNFRIRMIAGFTCSSSCPYGLSSITAGDIYTVAGTSTFTYNGDGRTASSANLYEPTSLALDAQGDLFIDDYFNYRIRMIAATTCASSCPYGLSSTIAGDIYTVAGSGGNGNPVSGNGGPATAAVISGSEGLTVDAQGNVVFSDANEVRMVAASTCTSLCAYGLPATTEGYIYDVAGTNAYGSTGDGGPALAAQIKSPWGLAVDRNGDLLLAQRGGQTVRMVAASTCSSGCVFGLASTVADDIYTVAGTGGYGSGGDGGPATSATLSDVRGITVDTQGNLLIADNGANKVRMVAAATCSSGCAFGLVSTVADDIYTVAGNGTGAFSGDSGSAVSAALQNPTGVAVDNQGNLDIADFDNSRIRSVSGVPLVFTSASSASFTAGTAGTFTVATSSDFTPSLTEAGSLPAGVTFVDNGNGSATLAGTPTAPGTYTVTVSATSGGVLEGTQLVTLSVSPAPPSITPAVNYWAVSSDGGVFTFGGAGFYGSAGGLTLNQPVVAMASTSDGRGYWLVAKDGGVFSYGDAAFHGSVPALGIHVTNNVGMAADAATGGYWLVGADGGVYAFDAPFDGSIPGLGQHVSNIVGIAATADSGGYYLVSSTGAVYAFGDARYQGGTNTLPHINGPIVGISVDAATGGYWEASSDGSVYANGAPFEGSAGGTRLNAPIVGVGATKSGSGYFLVASDGGVFAYGAPFLGSMGGKHLNTPMVGITVAG